MAGGVRYRFSEWAEHTAPIFTLPENTAKGQISATLYGLTVTQLIKNGNFANGLTNWSSDSLFTIEDGMLKVNTVIAFTVRQNVNIIAGHKYYISFYAISDGQADLAVMLRNEVTIISGMIGSQKSTAYTRYSGVVVATQNGDRLTINRRTIPQGDAYAKIDNIMLIDLTTHGLENKTVAELDAMFPVYFEGTKSTVGAMRLKSVSAYETETSTAYVVAKDEEGNIAELRSLPNGTKDEIRVSEGKAIIGTKRRILEASDFTALNQLANIDAILVRKQADDYLKGKLERNILSFKIESFTSKNVTTSDSVENVGCAYNITTDNYALVVAKGAYTSLADAQSKLAGLTLTYQLNDPIILDTVEVEYTENGQPSDHLKAWGPNTTIIVEVPEDSTIPTILESHVEVVI